jgi:hypothetical protein
MQTSCQTLLPAKMAVPPLNLPKWQFTRPARATRNPSQVAPAHDITNRISDTYRSSNRHPLRQKDCSENRHN